MTLRFGEVILIEMAFHQMAGAKVRPAIVVLDTGDDDFVAIPITSRARQDVWDLPVEKWLEAGLNVASWVRTHKATVQAKRDITRHLGSLASADAERLRALVCRAYCGR